MQEWMTVQYFVMPEKIAKFTKVAGLSLDELVKEVCNHPRRPFPRGEVEQMALSGGPTRDDWIVHAIAETLCVPLWKIVRYKMEPRGEEPLDPDISHFGKNRRICNPYSFMFLDLLWKKVKAGNGRSRKSAGKRREALHNEFDAASPEKRREMFRKFGKELELCLFVGVDLFYKQDDGLNMASIHAFRTVLQAAKPSYHRVSLILLWRFPEDSGRWEHAGSLQGSLLHSLQIPLQEAAQIHLAHISPDDGGKYGSILLYSGGHARKNVISECHVIDSRLADYSAEERLRLQFYYADSPAGFTDEDAEEFLYADIRCK